MKLIENKIIEGKIIIKTGLHIGGSSEIIEIGGMDNPIIKNPLTGEPYIPGSSLKGKMRSLLEWKTGNISQSGNPHSWDDCNRNRDCPICRIFGTSSGDANIGPTRLIIRDSFINEDCRNEIKKREKSFTEEKWENVIKRITAEATPRRIERVPAGIIFDLVMTFRIFEKFDNFAVSDEDLLEYVKYGLKLMQEDALGGYGSRGCGQVEFVDIKDEKGEKIDLNNIGEFEI